MPPMRYRGISSDVTNATGTTGSPRMPEPPFGHPFTHVRPDMLPGTIAGAADAAPGPDASTSSATDSDVYDADERYLALLARSPHAVAIHADGKLVFVNDAAAALLGAAGAADVEGRSILDIVHPDYHDLVLGRVREEVERGREAPLVEERFVRLDGEVIDVEVMAIPVRYAGRRGGQVFVRDITDRNRAERALLEQNDFLAALHRTTLDLMNRLHLPDLLQAIVSRAGALAGSPHGYIYLLEPERDVMTVRVGTGIFSEFVGHEMSSGEGLAGRVLSTGAPVLVADYDSSTERSATFPIGVLRDGMAVPLKSGGEVVGVIGLAHREESKRFEPRDMELLTRFAELASIALDNARLYEAAQAELENRRRIEDQLRRAEQKFRTLVEQVPAITYTDVIDESMTTLYISPQVERILGVRPEEWMDEPDLWASLLHPGDRDRAVATYLRGRDQAETFSFEYRMVARDGRVVWFRDEAVVIASTPERLGVVHGVMFDITERKRAEQDLQHALEREQEVGRALRQLDQMKTTFLHAVSHELRTPLSAILGLALTLERQEMDLSPEESQELLGRLASNARKLDNLLADLLDLDRLDRGIVQPRRRLIDVGALVRRVASQAPPAVGTKVHVATQTALVAVDGAKVERIVENLLANAMKHTPEGTTIWIRTGRRSDGVLIVVEDNGPGIDPDHHGSVFEPFERGARELDHSPGVGIGLSLVARFAELHGGRAWYEDCAGGGSSFRVFLPDAPASAA